MPEMIAIPGVPVFSWCQMPDANGTIKLRILRAQFGDGYQQRAGNGINPAVESWPLQFIGRTTYTGPIVAFLKERAGHKAFHWTPPDGELGLYACESISVRKMTAIITAVGVTFDQVFAA